MAEERRPIGGPGDEGDVVECRGQGGQAQVEATHAQLYAVAIAQRRDGAIEQGLPRPRCLGQGRDAEDRQVGIVPSPLGEAPPHLVPAPLAPADGAVAHSGLSAAAGVRPRRFAQAPGEDPGSATRVPASGPGGQAVAVAFSGLLILRRGSAPRATSTAMTSAPTKAAMAAKPAI